MTQFVNIIWSFYILLFYNNFENYNAAINTHFSRWNIGYCIGSNRTMRSSHQPIKHNITYKKQNNLKKEVIIYARNRYDNYNSLTADI